MIRPTSAATCAGFFSLQKYFSESSPTTGTPASTSALRHALVEADPPAVAGEHHREPLPVPARRVLHDRQILHRRRAAGGGARPARRSGPRRPGRRGVVAPAQAAAGTRRCPSPGSASNAAPGTSRANASAAAAGHSRSSEPERQRERRSRRTGGGDHHAALYGARRRPGATAEAHRHRQRGAPAEQHRARERAARAPRRTRPTDRRAARVADHERALVGGEPGALLQQPRQRLQSAAG